MISTLMGYILISNVSISIQPLGDVPNSYLAATQNAIVKHFKCKVTTQSPKNLPEFAWYKPRSRYRADLILSKSPRVKLSTKTLFILTKDISTTLGTYHDWGIFGLGLLNGDACVVSTYRLSNPKSQLLNRLRKVAVHEIGHTFGLSHCKSFDCVMADANGKIKTVDQNSESFCTKCRKQLDNNM